ncbi:MAG: SprT family protein [Bacilli bacterium]|nr:SprT family protein [Bacilli bacterium]
MTNGELQKWVCQISQTHFNRQFQHTARFNSRLRTTGGRYLLKSHSIELNPHHLALHGEEALLGTLKHELCHYHLHLMGKGYRHQDADFKELLARVGGSRYCPDTGLRRVSSKRYFYTCTRCSCEYVRKRKVILDKYRCGRCSGRLKLVSAVTAQ